MVFFEGYMQRLMNVTDPVPKEFERNASFGIGFILGGDNA
jgi:hypothetical protein